MQLTGACIFGQSGGPTSVINASAYGVISEALNTPCITKVLGAHHGIKGVLGDRLFDMSQEDPAELALLQHTPSSALGSCRYKLKNARDDDSDYRRILEVFRRHNVRYFFYNGGNDSMDTCNKISQYLASQSYDCRVIGVPKTIDNDLCGIDHCPGYGSAAKYIAATCMEVYHDAHVYDTGSVTIIEAMGRNAGWLTAAGHIAVHFGAGPDLIYLPEVPFDLDACIAGIKRCCDEKGGCMVLLSEGIKDKAGVYLAEYSGSGATDAFGHKQMGGAAATVAQRVKEQLGVKTRAIELSLLQRCAAHCASQTDIDEAVLLGREAVRAAVSGVSGKMMGIVRGEGDAYRPEIAMFDLTATANAEKKFPLEWIDAKNAGISDAFLQYSLPLIQGQPQFPWENGVPRFAHLKKVLAE